MGDQYELRHADQRVVVTEVGGGLREYVVGDRPVLDGYADDEVCGGARGQTLLPWPNRIADGSYTFGGTTRQLALTEPDKHTAIHGLTRWQNWRVLDRAGDRLSLGLRLHAQIGWPFVLDCRLDYTLGAAGLTVRTSATNVGAHPCPYATGAHPYLTVGSARIDPAHARVPGALYYPTDDRGIPTGKEPVGGKYDLREAQQLGDRQIDVAYTDLTRDDDGKGRVRLALPEGPAVALWVDETYPYLEIFTGDALPEPDKRRTGLGVEPMTAAPNAFQTGDGLLTLEPGSTHAGEWGIEPQI
jgi:aldose 1-epimerase